MGVSPPTVLSVLQSEVGCVFPKAVKSLFRKHNGGIRVYDFLTLSDDVRSLSLSAA